VERRPGIGNIPALCHHLRRLPDMHC
jgi:hypothetical protein